MDVDLVWLSGPDMEQKGYHLINFSCFKIKCPLGVNERVEDSSLAYKHTIEYADKLSGNTCDR